MRIRALSWFLFVFVVLVGCTKSHEPSREAVSLAELPAIYWPEYRVDPYLEAANKLQALGKNAAIEQLIALSRSPLTEAEKRMWFGESPKKKREDMHIIRSSKSDVLQEQWKIAVLCRMLFKPRPGMGLDRPALGNPHFLGNANYTSYDTDDPIFKKWRLEPIEVVDGIPFVVVTGYEVEGIVDPSGTERYVRYCATNCDWSNTRFTMKSKEQKKAALQKMISSPKWERPLHEWEQEYLRKQLQSKIDLHLTNSYSVKVKPL